MAYWQTLKAQLNEARGEKKAKKIRVSNFLSFNYSPWEGGKTEEGRRKRKQVSQRTILRIYPADWPNQKKVYLVSLRVS